MAIFSNGKTSRHCDWSFAPQVGLEPTTTRLTAGCSAIELLRNMGTGSDLSSRAVSSQVLSALESLTTVFGMGTGGTSPSLPPVGVSRVFDPFPFAFATQSVAVHNPFGLHPDNCTSQIQYFRPTIDLVVFLSFLAWLPLLPCLPEFVCSSA